MSTSLAPPTGRVTILFSDIEGSTALWESCPEAMTRALREHDTLFRETAATLGGYEVKAEGDAFMIAFETPETAFRFAVVVQENLGNMPWPRELLETQRERGMVGKLGVRVRMGIAEGAPESRVNPTTQRMDYFGPSVNLAARLCDMAHGAQVIISEPCLADDLEIGGAVLESLGHFTIRGFTEPQGVAQLVSGSWWPMEFPPLRLDRVAPPPKSARSEREETLTDHVAAACDKLLAQTVVERRSGMPDEARRHLDCLEATARWLDDPERLVEGWHQMALVLANQNDNPGALELSSDALDVARLQLSDAHLVRSLRAQTRHLTWNGQFDAARECMDEAAQIARRLGDENELVVVQALEADICRLEGRLEEAEQRFEDAIEVMERRGLGSEARRQRNLLMVAYVESGDPRCLLHAELLIEQFQSLGMLTQEASTKANLSLYYLDQNEQEAFDELTRFCTEAFRYAGIDFALTSIAVNEAFFHLQRGRLDEAKARLERIAHILEKEPAKERSETLLLWSLLHLFRGDLALAKETASTGIPMALQDLEFIGPIKVSLLQVCAHLASHEHGKAQEIFLALERPNSTTCRVAWRLLGRLLDLENKSPQV